MCEAGIYDRRRYAEGMGPAGCGDSGSSSEHTGFDEHTYVVECPCGVTYDDGQMMIECETCKAWAHNACLQAQMVSCLYRRAVRHTAQHWAIAADTSQL